MSDQPRLTFLGKLAILLFVGACFAGAYFLWQATSGAKGGAGASGPSGGGTTTGGTATNTPTSGNQPGGADAVPAGDRITIGIAYGTEKRTWLTWAVEEFAKTKDGKKIEVKLIPLGSIEAAHAIVKGDQSINVWSPASSLYKYQLADEWKMKNSGEVIAKEEPLALTPMVFVFWDERYEAFVAKYQEANFRTISKALAEPGGWGGIAKREEWGLFKFGHTHPNQSNSGLMTLVLEAQDYYKKSTALTLGDITGPEFQTWSSGLWRGASGLSNSTGNMMREMVQRGPSTYDALFVYESTAIDFIKSAEGRWGKLRVVYPARNVWNDNPYYVLNVPWSTNQQRKASETFLAFLLSDTVQRQALVHGFRPANVAVPVNGPESPFVQYASYGLKIEMTTVCEPPPPEVINNLLLGWQRVRPN
jgi:Ca-activated chloride channel family protein